VVGDAGLSVRASLIFTIDPTARLEGHRTSISLLLLDALSDAGHNEIAIPGNVTARFQVATPLGPVYHHTNQSRKELMVKRISLVWKRPELSDSEFRSLWLGEHVRFAKRLNGLREYVIDFVTQGPADGPSGVATLRFDSRQALDAAFGDPALTRDLMRTREEFARAVQVMMVDEETVVPLTPSDER
jgi:uncharacterized protein (TIGR02118 family)